MIDSHFHLEQPQYKDREELIQKWKQELSAVITSCASPKDLSATLEFVKRWPGFVFATAGLHPQYVNYFTDTEVDEYIKKILKNSDKLVGIGEVGIDFFHLKDEKSCKLQEDLFIRFIELSNKANLPLIIHSRDGHETTLKILEQEDAKKVYWHMCGVNKLIEKIINNDYYIGANAIIMRSKNYKKVIRNVKLERILTETDAPWLHPDTFTSGKKTLNDPLTVKSIINRIAEIKNLDFEIVNRITTDNAIKFFNLSI